MASVAATRLGRTFIARQRMVNVFVTNVVGPAAPLYILGSRILDVVPFLSDAGNVTVLWCVLSYADRLYLAVTVDSDACPEIDRIVAGMESTWGELPSRAEVAT